MLTTIAFAALPARSQGPTRIRRIGFLWENVQPNYFRQLDAFRTGMRDLGYTEGKHYAIEQRSAQNDSARLPAAVQELLALKVDVIVSSGTPSAEAARKATRDTPILIATVGDPVGSGFAATLSRPGGNVTGLTSMTTELYTKRLDLLRQILPAMRRAGFLYNPDNNNDKLGLTQFEADCRKLQLTPMLAPVRKAEEVATAFKSLQQDKAEGLIVSQASSNLAWLQRIVDAAAQHRLPTVYPIAFYVDHGGLISYAANTLDLWRRTAAYADKIFKGAKAGDLPIEQPTTFELFVNLKAAKALGVTIPQAILVRADRVIE
jgi:ABC-type uncharacterized transport system substrate-binding protein